jgi:hypothetical protein
MLPEEQIYPYSIFLIEKGNVLSLKTALKTKMKITSKKKIAQNTFTFFFSEKPPDTPVHWMDIYKPFLPKLKQRYNQVYFGVLLVEVKGGRAFAVSLGKAHFYVEPYCDTEFGLDLAERIADPTEIKEKGSKHLFNIKNQSIVSYRKSSEVSDYESGEFYRRLVASTISEAQWGKRVAFGENIHFNLAIKPIDLSPFLICIQKTLAKRIKVEIPRVKQIKEVTIIKKLERALIKALNQLSTKKDDEDLVLTWKDKFFNDDSQFYVYARGNKKDKQKLTAFDIQSLKFFAKSNNILIGDELNNLQIEIVDADGYSAARSLKFFVDYTDDKGNCFLDGKWQHFNQSYIDYLKKFVDSVEVEYNPKQNLSKKKLAAFLAKNKEFYAEQYFNLLREKEGYINKDRDIILLDKKYRVECMDLYKGRCLFFVKIGTLQKLSYVIDQAKNTLLLFKSKQVKIQVKQSNIRPKQICLWLILDRRTEVEKLSDLDSLIFHTKLTEWIHLSKSMNMTPIVKVNYKID